MTRRPSKRFILVAAALAATVSLLGGCGDDFPRGIGDVGDDGGGTQPITGDLIGTLAFGPAGGELEAGDVTVRVPAGAFAADTELKIYRDANGDSPSGTPVYRVDGLPEGFAAPVRVGIPAPIVVKNPSAAKAPAISPLAVGEVVFITSLQESKQSWRILQAPIDAGKLWADIPTPDAGTPTGTVDISRADDVTETLTSSGGHFLITYPFLYATGAANLGTWLEEALAKITAAGFSTAGRTAWPVEITVLPLNDTVFGYAVNSSLGDNHGWLEFNSGKLADATETRATAIHELMHMVQSWYDPRTAFMQSKTSGPNLWLDEATSVWSEQLMSADPATFVSSIRSGHEMAPFRGMAAGIGDKPAWHGYGMSGMVDYLVDGFGAGDAMAQVYNRIRDGAVPAAAIDDFQDCSLWYADFMDKYADGRVCPDMDLSRLLGNIAGTVEFGSDTDDPKSVSRSYPDLSAALYRVRWSGTGFTNGSALEFSVTDADARVSVFKYNGGGMTKVGGPQSLVTAADIKSMVDSGDLLLALVVNTRSEAPFTAARNISLTMRPIESGDRFGYTCHFYFDSYGLVTEPGEDPVYGVYSSGFSVVGEGSWVGDTFNGIEDVTLASGARRLQHLTLTRSGDTIATCAADLHEEKMSYWLQDAALVCAGIPRDFSETNYIKYELKGADALAAAVDLDNRIEYEDGKVIEAITISEQADRVGGYWIDIGMWPLSK